ncbi:MAG: site-specific integrase [Mailhella sp.]|nr:site-specific integrase [Mailhella sp.]
MNDFNAPSSSRSLDERYSHSRHLSQYGSYILLYRGNRYFRVIVPFHLRFLIGKTEIRRSLDGLSSREARTKASRLYVVARTFFEVVEEILAGRIQFVHEVCAQHPEFITRIVRFLDTIWFTEACEKDLSSAALMLKLPEFLKECVNSCGISQDNGASAPQVDQCLEAEVCVFENERTAAPLAQVTRKPRRVIIDEMTTYGEKARNRDSDPLPKLSEAAEAYIAAKKLTWSKGSSNQIPPQIHQFVEIVKELEKGRDISIGSLTRDHVRLYYDTLKHLPYRTSGRTEYSGMSWLKMAEMGRTGKIDRLLSLKTMQVRQINVRSFINWAELEYRGLVQARYLNSGFPDVLSNRDVRRKSTKRSSFSVDELKALFGNREKYLHETRKYPSRFWAPWIALYTGMRIEEICQLHISDIREIEGVMCFSVNEERGFNGESKHVKTMAGIRSVPIHPWLWTDAGLKDFVSARKAEIIEKNWKTTLLFSDMQARTHLITSDSTQKLSAPVTSWFMRYRRSVGVGGDHGETSEKTFHSFRHTVIEYLLKEARVPLSMVQTVVGHEVTDMGVTEVYAGSWSMKVLRDEVIAKLNWYM